MADPAIQAFFLTGLTILAAVAAVTIGLALIVRLRDRLMWRRYDALCAAEAGEKKQDENWRLRHEV